MEQVQQCHTSSRRHDPCFPTYLKARAPFLFASHHRIRHPIQNTDALNMPRLRKKITTPQTLNLIPPTPSATFPIPLLPSFIAKPPNQHPHIPRLRMHITANINHPPRPKPRELSQKILTRALSRRGQSPLNSDPRETGHRRRGQRRRLQGIRRWRLS